MPEIVWYGQYVPVAHDVHELCPVRVEKEPAAQGIG